MSEQNMQHPNPKERWKNMRRMAWMAMIICAILTGVIIYQNLLADNIGPVFLFWGSIIGCYMGFSTARDGWGNK